MVPRNQVNQLDQEVQMIRVFLDFPVCLMVLVALGVLEIPAALDYH